MMVKVALFSDVTPCSFADCCQRFAGTCRINLQGRIVFSRWL